MCVCVCVCVGGSNNCWLLEKASTSKISKLACRQDSETERHEKKKRDITVDLIT